MASHCVVFGISAVECAGSAPSGASPAGDCSLLNWQATVQLSGVNGQFNPRGCTVALTQHDLLRLLADRLFALTAPSSASGYRATNEPRPA
jgi:hypothetical protein